MPRGARIRSEPVGGGATDSPLAAQPTLTLADLAAYPLALNTVSGTTTVELWAEHSRPHVTLEVANTDDWLAAIAAGVTFAGRIVPSNGN